MAITGHPGAYLHVEELIEVAKLLGLNSSEEISSVEEAIARNGTMLRVADFVHGKDGLGNQNFPPPEEIVSEAFTDLSSRKPGRTEPGVAKSGWCLLLRTYAVHLGGKSEEILGEAARVSGRFISSKEQFKGSNTICLNVTF
ncbi:hypothetical protein YC2023_020423 [Brassica napus]